MKVKNLQWECLTVTVTVTARVSSISVLMQWLCVSFSFWHQMLEIERNNISINTDFQDRQILKHLPRESQKTGEPFFGGVFWFLFLFFFYNTPFFFSFFFFYDLINLSLQLQDSITIYVIFFYQKHYHIYNYVHIQIYGNKFMGKLLYSRSIIYTCSLLSHEQQPPLIKFMVGPIM